MTTPALVDPAPPRCQVHRTRQEQRATRRIGSGCFDCRRYEAWYSRTRDQGKKAGTWQGYIDVTETYLHVRALLDHGGRTIRDMAAESGVSLRVVEYVAGGRGEKIHQLNATALVALRPPPFPNPPRVDLVHAHGSVRRLRGLAYDGWTFEAMGDRLGLHRTAVHHITRVNDHVTVEMAERIRRLADALDGQIGPSRRTADMARAKGWHPLDAWHDIDDPLAEPHVPDDGEVDMTAVRRILRGEPAQEYLAAVAAEFLPRERYAVQLAQRDEAVRAGSVPAPYGPGLSAAELGELVGATERTVQRVRARQLEAESGAAA